MRIVFDRCFDPRKLEAIAQFLPDVFAVMQEMAPWYRTWPSRVECMPDKDILAGRKRGAGHGQYSPSENRVWVSPYMDPIGILGNIIHEFGHAIWPDATEHELNNLIVPHVLEQVFGYKIDVDCLRMHGLGPIVNGLSGRGYASNSNRARMLRGERP